MRTQFQPNPQNQPSRSAWYTQGGQGVVTTPSSEYVSPISASPATTNAQWPDAVAYRESIQTPGSSLAPPELRGGSISIDRRGMPLAYSGRFAVVFRAVGSDKRQWALRCFTAPPQAEAIPRADRYRLIASHVSELGNLFVPFKYFEQGIRVANHWYPMVAMRWASGETLGKFTDRNLNNPEALRNLAGTLSTLLKRLEDAGIAHGDWQHDNLLVSEDGNHVTLVDYDGMWVSEFAGLASDEIGHPNYQHPARTPYNFGAHMDRFACLTMQSALLALAYEPALWTRFSDGESLLFKKADFQDPSISPVFRALREVAEKHKDELLADSLARLEDACRHAPDAVMEPAIAVREDVLPIVENDEWSTLPTTATILPSPKAIAGEETVVVAPSTSTSSRWWQAGPAINLPSPAQQQQAVASNASNSKWFTSQTGQTPVVMGGAGQAQAYQPVETWAFIERLYRDETLSAERKHFLMSRAGLLLLAGFTVLFVLSLFGHGGSFPFYLFFWVFNIGSLGYANWPRKKIYDELEAEIAKMEKLMNERREKIAARRYANAPGGTPNAAAFGTLHEYVNDRLSKTSVNQVLNNLPGITIATLKTLRNEGITTALHLQGRVAIPGIPPHEVAALQQWCRDIEMRAADEYRHSGASSRPQVHTAEIARLEQEAAEFERERDRLLREKAQFPDVGFWNVWWRKLFGLPEGGANPNNAAPTP